MKPSFPSLTFPNHYSMVTGNRPETHGIIANRFYDSLKNTEFGPHNMNDIDLDWWSGDEPLWNTFEETTRLKSAICYWPGSEAAIKGRRPSYFKKFNPLTSIRDRFKTLLDWIDLPIHERPFLLISYMNLIDDLGHAYGPDSSKIDDGLKLLDDEVKFFLDGLKARNIFDKVNVIFVSDHGMSQVKSVVYIDTLMDMSLLSYYDLGALSLLYPKSGVSILNIYQTLKQKLHEINSEFEVYLRKDIPNEYHYQESHRIAPIVILAPSGWDVRIYEPKFEMNGRHGYKSANTDMNAILISKGPNIKDFVQIPEFNNIDLYILLHNILIGKLKAPKQCEASDYLSRLLLK